MQKYLITGFSGFVSKNFIEYLNNNFCQSSILGIDFAEPSFNISDFENLKIKFEKSDLKDKDRISKIIYDYSPDYILHLASCSSVAESWRSPGYSFQNNLNIFLNLLEVLRLIGKDCRIVSAGSSEVYGIVKFSDLPVREEQVLNPLSPFGIARYSQELLAKLYSNIYGMDIIITRSFNHIGPGQKENFAVSSFAKQLSCIMDNNETEFVVTGDVSVVRDFIDVRDVVRAYHQLFLKGKKGEVYNICSGYGISLQNVIQMMCEILEIKITIKEDKKLRRPLDIPVIVGCNEKLRKETNWTNEILLEKSLKDILEYNLYRRENSKKFTYH